MAVENGHLIVGIARFCFGKVKRDVIPVEEAARSKDATKDGDFSSTDKRGLRHRTTLRIVAVTWMGTFIPRFSAPPIAMRRWTNYGPCVIFPIPDVETVRQRPVEQALELGCW